MMVLRLVNGNTDMGDAYEEVGDMRLYVMDNGEPMTLASMTAKGLSFEEAKSAAAKDMEPVIYPMARLFGVDKDDSKALIVCCADGRGKPRPYSAAAIMLPQVQETLERFYGGAFFAIPSSVHECITIPADRWCREDLEKMLNDVNHMPVAVGEGEELSSKVLKWAPDKKRFV